MARNSACHIGRIGALIRATTAHPLIPEEHFAAGDRDCRGRHFGSWLKIDGGCHFVDRAPTLFLLSEEG